MANGSDVTKKVKDAIKAKLLELGAYVDDELPDYIMVLVANKKSKLQMDEDLSLFLGHNTERFTSWLHGVLQRLNAASFLQGTNNIKETTTICDQNEAVLMKERLELKKEISEKRKEKKEKKKKKSKDKKEKKEKSRKKVAINQENTTESTEIVRIEKVTVPEEATKLPVKKINVNDAPISTETVRKEADILDIQTGPQDLPLESDEEPVISEPQPKIIQRTIHQNVIKPEDNNKNTIQNEKKVSSIRERLGPFSTDKKTVTLKEEPNIPLKSTIEIKSVMGRVLSSSIASAVRSVTQTDRSGRVQTKLEARVKPLMNERIKRHASDDEEEVQPKKSLKLTSVVRPVINQEESKAVGIASKVEVVPRPRRVGSGHANTALILRAVADAHKSVNRPVKRPANDAIEHPVAKRKQIFTKAYRGEMKEEPKVRKIAITVPNTTDKHSPTQDEDSSDDKILYEESGEEELPLDEEFELKDDIQDTLSPSDRPTRFFITMEGMPEKSIKGRLGNRRDSIVEDEYIEEIEEWEEVEESSVVTEATTEPVKTEEAPLVAVPTKKEEKCKFWPDCKGGENCRFVHPIKTCVMFPNCKFGNKCLYVHPQCKFDATCTKLNCPYSHTSKSVAAVLGMAVSKIKCRFFPKCTDMNCPYLHPKQVCRYGRFCKLVNCIYIHPEVAYGSKLKWIAPKSGNNPLIEEPVLSVLTTEN